MKSIGVDQIGYTKVTIASEQGLTQKELADKMHVGKAAVTKAVKILVLKGLVHLAVNAADLHSYL